MFAESTPDPANVGLWLQIAFYIVAGMAAIVGVSVGIKKLIQPPPIKDQPVTRVELDKEILRLETKLDQEAVKMDLAIRELKEDVKQRHHALANTLNPIRLKLERIDIFMGMLMKKAGIEVPSSPQPEQIVSP